MCCEGCSVKPLLEENKPHAGICHMREDKNTGRYLCKTLKNLEAFNIYENFNYVERSELHSSCMLTW